MFPDIFQSLLGLFVVLASVNTKTLDAIVDVTDATTSLQHDDAKETQEVTFRNVDPFRIGRLLEPMTLSLLTGTARLSTDP